MSLKKTISYKVALLFLCLLYKIYIMRKPIYSEEQIEEINQNIYVKNCTSKSISYTPEGKIKAVDMQKPDLTPKDIFRLLWLPEYVYNTDFPRKCLQRWTRMVRYNWIEALEKDKRWTWKWPTKVDTSNMTMEEENTYLKALLAYTKEENKHLEVLKKTSQVNLKNLT